VDTARARFNELYQEWREGERRVGLSASRTGFAHVLGYDSHSAVGDMLNGKRALSADVLRAASERWDINPNWLLGYDGPRYSFEVLTEGTLEDMLGKRVLAEVAARIKTAPLKGRGIAPSSEPLELAEGAGERLLAFVVDTVEEALRVSYPVAVAASLVKRSLADAVARVETDSSEATIHAASLLAAVGQALQETRRALLGVPLADAPPIRVRVTL
jgi:hypothetical protein